MSDSFIVCFELICFLCQNSCLFLFHLLLCLLSLLSSLSFVSFLDSFYFHFPSLVITPPTPMSPVHLSPVQTEMCVYSDVFLCKLPAVLRCVTALLAVTVEGEEAAGVGEETEESRTPRSSSSSSPFSSALRSSSSPSYSSSLLSTGFLLFYTLAMALLYTLYCHLLA